jgi:sporulation protein YlmC with PRC-barrel domain
MRLLLGSHVRENGRRVGRLAGFEFEPTTGKIRRIVFSPDGDLGPQAHTRPLAMVATKESEIEIRSDVDPPAMAAVRDVILLSSSTRVRRAGHEIGRLAGIGVNEADRALTEVLGRAHWWSRRFSLQAGAVDCSTPGEIRVSTSGDTQAA